MNTPVWRNLALLTIGLFVGMLSRLAAVAPDSERSDVASLSRDSTSEMPSVQPDADKAALLAFNHKADSNRTTEEHKSFHRLCMTAQGRAWLRRHTELWPSHKEDELLTLAVVSRRDGDDTTARFLVDLTKVRGSKVLRKVWGIMLNTDPLMVWELNIRNADSSDGGLFTERAAQALAINFPGKLREEIARIPESQRLAVLGQSIGAVAADEGVEGAILLAAPFLASDSNLSRRTVTTLIGEGVWHSGGPELLREWARAIPDSKLKAHAESQIEEELKRLGTFQDEH